jgi:glycosyltransferase involved in cell wall biosynthesis
VDELSASRRRADDATAEAPQGRVAQDAAIAAVPNGHPVARGRFLFVGETKLWLRGVTYGTFRHDDAGREYPPPSRLDADFSHIVASGFNTLRTYTVPPRDVLDAAQRHGLRVLVGLPWEQHVTFLDDPRRAESIVVRVRDGVRACAGHPAVLAYAVGNEIPAPIVRWHGRRAVERFLARLARTVRAADPGALVTYVNYPTTEYLDLPFLDVVCFNVYLEARERLDAYLARLHNLAGDRPLLLTEVGLDSRRHGTLTQARTLDWQLRAAFASGCAGAFVFAWTDEWHRGGFDVEDWDFGITDRARRPKPALPVVRKALDELPLPRRRHWPRVSVVVCSRNGARTIRDTLEGLRRLEYPDFEVIVVDDGSTDATAAIAREYPFSVISTPNGGLSAARNIGLSAATGVIVAYIDDDAWPDPHWLHYLVATLTSGGHAGVGGPNLPPPGDGWIAACVGRAPGGPTQVLVTDTEAEHVPGCNMAFRKAALEAIGGFDRQFRAAGDDVDVCWRLRDRGWTLGFSAAAVVWHHRRNSVRAYWRQQVGYGRAESMLERKWPERYNAAGHAAWAGRLYGTTPVVPRRGRIYQGVWGTAAYQSLYEGGPTWLASLPTMPEWTLLVVALAALAGLGAFWKPLWYVALPALALAAAAPLVHALLAACSTPLREPPPGLAGRARMRLVIAWLHLMQPNARLWGRLEHGLTLWRAHGRRAWALPRTREFATWSDVWRSPAARLEALERELRAAGFVVGRGGVWDRWDLSIRGGALGGARVRMATEEHGAGRQLSRFRVWPRWSSGAVVAAVIAGALAGSAALAGAPIVAGVLGVGVATLCILALRDCAAALAAVVRAGEDGVAERAAVEADRVVSMRAARSA